MRAVNVTLNTRAALERIKFYIVLKLLKEKNKVERNFTGLLTELVFFLRNFVPKDSAFEVY